MLLRAYGIRYAILSYIFDILAALVSVSLGNVLAGLALGPEATAGLFTVEALVMVLVIWPVVFHSLMVYDPERTYYVVDEFSNIFKANLLAFSVLIGALFFTEIAASRTLLLIFFLLNLLTLLGWRSVYRLLCRVTSLTRYPVRHVIIVGINEQAEKAVRMIERHRWAGLRFAGYVVDDDEDVATWNQDQPILGTLGELSDIVAAHNAEEVFINLGEQSSEKFKRIVNVLRALPVYIRVIPDYLSESLYAATAEPLGDKKKVNGAAEQIDDLLLINLRAPVLTSHQYLMKRLFDIVVATVALILVAPVMIVTAIAIRLDSPGSVIFKQTRVGENGRHFNIYKFRSMVADADRRRQEVVHYDEEGNIIHKTENDPRVTRIGNLIRRTSIDELPQLFNVLKGDMSIVGPRPEMPWLVESYKSWQYMRFAVPQGITGWWQVNGRSDKLMHLNTEYDLYYVKNYSLLLDLRILFMTFRAVFKKAGAF